MKRLLAVILGTMAIGGAAMTPALASSPMPGADETLAVFTKELRRGMNLVELEGAQGGIVIDKDGDTLYAFATSAEQRRPLPDGNYKLRRPGVSECGVRDGIVEWCR